MTETNRMEFLKEYDLEKDSKLKIQISVNLMNNFYSQNYISEFNVF